MTHLLETDQTAVSTQRGFRLARLEVCNWGTFDSVNKATRGRIYTVEPDGATTLLIGRNGSGKSTLVDALLTLLVRPQVRNYNVAAGAKKQERDPRTYVKGAFDRQSDDDQRAVALFHRPDGKHLSVLLACFRNRQTRQVFTVAQVLYVTTDGKVEKVYCFAADERSIEQDCSGLRSTEKLAAQMKQRGFRATTSYTEYFGWLQKQTGMQDLAMDLLNQTVALKDIGGLTKFVRAHMLDARPWAEKVDRLLSHFTQLNEAWQALLRVRCQHDLLLPVREHGDEYTRQSAQLRRAQRILEATDSYFCQKRVELLEPECERLRQRLNDLASAEQRLANELRSAQENSRRLRNEIDLAGGDRLKEIPGLIRVEEAQLAQKHSAFDRLQRLLKQAGLEEPVSDPVSLARVQQQLDRLFGDIRTAIEHAATQRDDLLITRSTVETSLRDDERELAALQRRQGNLPESSAEVRQKLCDDLRLPVAELPFAAELIAVRPEEQSWEASIELELRPFALSLLVPERYYRAVSQYVERTQLRDARSRGQRLVYLKIGQRGDEKNAAVPHPQSLVHKLELRPGHPLVPWVRAELESRFDYRCCETIEEFQQFHGRAMTRSRHVKSGAVRHSKDDRERSVDPRSFVLGWDNREKKRRLSEAIDSHRRQLDSLLTRIAACDEELRTLRTRETAISQLREFTDFESIDFARHEEAIKRLEIERRELEAGNETVQRLKQSLAESQQQELALELQKRQAVEQQGDLKRQLASGEKVVENSRRTLNERESDGTLAVHAESFAAIDEYVEQQLLTVDDVLTREAGFKEERRQHVERVRAEIEPVRGRLQKAMSQFLRQCPEETTDLVADVEYLTSFLERLRDIEDEGLPQHTQRFRERLNDKVTREIQLLNSELDQERDTITDRIELLNQSLTRIYWNQSLGTHIRLEAQLVRDPEVTAFRQGLLECLSGTFDGSPEADEARFVRIEKLIGRLREESRWRDKVTDVRNWFEFAAREFDEATGEGRSYFQDSAGQSGGEKAKLAFTILVAAIAYQYDLDPHREVSDRFHFVVVDEMFSKIDDQYGRYALDLFQQFGLQLLIVAPLDAKARVTEPYVGCYLLVTKDELNFSQIHQMTAREFRDQVDTLRATDTKRPTPPDRPR
ncbi:AAA family ATPase [bacterium]|nr:AAA family ATPase [bacterium]